MTQKVLKLALDALEANYLLVNGTETHGGLEHCLDGYYSGCFNTDPINKQTEEAITAIKEALAQEQEPVAWAHYDTFKNLDSLTTARFKATLATKNTGACCIALYTTPPQRTWVKLEGEEIRNSWEEATKPDRSTMTIVTSFARAIEAKLKDKNCVG